jgi:hypothetical protein
MGSADYLDLKTELIAGFPSGMEDWIDWFDPDGPGPLLEADAHVLEDCGTGKVDELRRELSPLTCSIQGIQRWERTLGLQNSKVTIAGTETRRRAQVLARLREYGPPTKALVQTVLNAFLVYDDQTQIVILESRRDLLRVKNAKTWNGSEPFGPGTTATLTWVVWDDPRVSKGGAQVDLNVTCADLGTLEATLTAPDGTAHSVPLPIGVGARAGGPGGVSLRLYFPQFVGHTTIFGTWTLELTSNNVGDNVIQGILLVEALGRYHDWLGKPRDGLGAAMYEWGVVVEQAKLGAGAELQSALQAVWRLSYARSKGSIIRKPANLLIAEPDRDWTIPDQVVPGT